MANLQLRSIDDQLYETLGRRAAIGNRSISQEVVAILKVYLTAPASQNNSHTENFLELCGTWQDERSAEQIIKEIKQGDGAPVAILDRNEPVFYAVPAVAYELLMGKLEDMELAAIVEARKGQPEIEVNIEDGSPRKLGGSWEGKVEIAEDFDKPDDTLTDSFYHSSIFPGKE